MWKGTIYFSGSGDLVYSYPNYAWIAERSKITPYSWFLMSEDLELRMAAYQKTRSAYYVIFQDKLGRTYPMFITTFMNLIMAGWGNKIGQGYFSIAPLRWGVETKNNCFGIYPFIDEDTRLPLNNV